MDTTQSRVKNKSICPTNISLPDSCIEQTLTDASAWGTSIHNSNNFF